MADTAIFDVDGTLVDSNYQHAMAWFRAFRRFDITPPLWRIHRTIGMGGDLLVAELAGPEVEREHGEAVREAWGQEYDALVDEVQPFEGTEALLREVKERGFRLVLASSGKAQHVEASLDLFGGRDLADAWTTSADTEHSKPEPDIVQTALAKVGGTGGVMIGDATWDCIAAARLDVPTVALRTGGCSADELRDAGASWVFDSVADLHDHLDDTPLSRPTTAAPACRASAPPRQAAGNG